MEKNMRSKTKKIIKGLGLSVVICTCIYTTFVYECLKTFIKPRPDEYNKNETNERRKNAAQ